MPPVYLFTDARLLPKWYLFVSVLAVTGLLAAVAWLRGKPLLGGIGALASFGKVFTIATALECLWVVVCIVKDGLRQVGEVGTLGNPAELALHLCIAIPIAVMLAMGNRERKWLALYGAAAVLFVVVLLLTQSRTGLICLALDGIHGVLIVAQGLLTLLDQCAHGLAAGFDKKCRRAHAEISLITEKILQITHLRASFMDSLLILPC